MLYKIDLYEGSRRMHRFGVNCVFFIFAPKIQNFGGSGTNVANFERYKIFHRNQSCRGANSEGDSVVGFSLDFKYDFNGFQSRKGSQIQKNFIGVNFVEETILRGL